MFSWTLSLNFTILGLTTLFSPENASKFYTWKAKTASKTQQLILIYTQLNIYFNLWTKFSLTNRQPSKALKFSRQPSKLEKNNRQRSKLSPHWDPRLSIMNCKKEKWITIRSQWTGSNLLPWSRELSLPHDFVILLFQLNSTKWRGISEKPWLLSSHCLCENCLNKTYRQSLLNLTSSC